MSTDTSGSASDTGNAGNAPRITLEVIEEHIVHEGYFTAEEGVIGADIVRAQSTGATDIIGYAPESLQLLTICVLTLRNGYTVLGKSACASPENFSQEIGKKVAREDAIRQIWPLLGYELRSKLNKVSVVGDDKLGEALTLMIAHSLGNSEVFKESHSKIILDHFTTDEGEEGGRTY